ncbi:MAG TPA: hypothetical protein VGE58_12895 [Daejeonella sp.]
MTNDKEYEALYAKGFNDGYLLSKYKPDLYRQISTTGNAEHPYFNGLQQGHRQVERELFLQSLQDSRQLNEELKHKPKM